jgi:hypothetical protein
MRHYGKRAGEPSPMPFRFPIPSGARPMSGRDAVFIEPKLGRAGLTETEARQRGIAVRVCDHAHGRRAARPNAVRDTGLHEGHHRRGQRVYPRHRRAQRSSRRGDRCRVDRDVGGTPLYRVPRRDHRLSNDSRRAQPAVRKSPGRMIADPCIPAFHGFDMHLISAPEKGPCFNGPILTHNF